MPNKRSDNKRGISVYVPKDIKDGIQKLAQDRGIAMSDLVTTLYREELKRAGIKTEVKNA